MASYIVEHPDCMREYRVAEGSDCTWMRVEFRVLRHDGNPYDDRWYLVTSEYWDALINTSRDTYDLLAAEHKAIFKE